MLEIHPFGYFAPKNSKYLILGSFTGKDYSNDSEYDWFYSSKRNQFWQILRNVYDLPLSSKKEKTNLFSKLHIAISDIIYSCERKNGNNLDNNLINITYNREIIKYILDKNNIIRIYFTSKFVEKSYKVHFKFLLSKYPNIIYEVLPSPSPRYAKLSLVEKIEIYKSMLPKLN